jgi:hypothetical protein
MPQPVAERLALDEFHDQKGRSLVLLNGVDRDHVGVIDGGGRSRFPNKTATRGGATGQFAGHHLDGHRPQELLIFGPKYDAHSAVAQHLEDNVLPQVAKRPCLTRRLKRSTIEPGLQLFFRGWLRALF